MEYNLENGDDFTLLKLSKDITIYELITFREALAALKSLTKPGQQAIIDLEEVGSMDPLALGIFTVFSKSIREVGGEVKLIHLKDDVRFVFDQSHLSKVYGIFDSLQDALKSA